MAITTPPALTDAPTSPDRSDRTTFTARSIALDDWRKLTHIAELRAMLANVYANALEAFSLAAATQSDRIVVQTAAAAVAAQSPVDNAAAAAAAAAAAQGYATLAQATNPDAPIRMNPRKITADLNIASAYNAQSTGPIAIAEGVTVTVSDNATWAVS